MVVLVPSTVDPIEADNAAELMSPSVREASGIKLIKNNLRKENFLSGDLTTAPHTFSEKEKEKEYSEEKRDTNAFDWSVKTIKSDWLPEQPKQTSLINVDVNEACSASIFIDKLNNDKSINTDTHPTGVKMEDLTSTFSDLAAAKTPPVANRTRSKSKPTTEVIISPFRPRSSSVSSLPSTENTPAVSRTTAEIIAEIERYRDRPPTSEKLPLSSSFTNITVNTLLTPQNSDGNVFGSSGNQRNASTTSTNMMSLTANDLARALGSQNILTARNECQNAVEKAPLSSKNPYAILTFLRTLKETLLKFVDTTGNSGLPYKSLDEAFVDGVTQRCFIGDASSIFDGLIKTNPPKVTFDSFATAIKALYCSGLTDQTILGNASFFRWELKESPADASLRLAMSLNSLSTSPNQSEVKRFFIYGCRDVYPELHERLLSFQHNGKMWTDASVSLDDIVKYCNIKCKHLWTARSKDSDRDLTAMMDKMNSLEALLVTLKNPQHSGSTSTAKSYERPKRSIINYAHSIGMEPETLSDFSTVMTIFTANVGPPTDEEITDFNYTKNLVLNAFNRNAPPYATGVPQYGRNFPGNCFVCDKPGHRSNECELLVFAKAMAGNDLFQKWKDEQNKGNFSFHSTNVVNSPLKAANETISLVDNSDVSLSELNVIDSSSFINKSLLDSSIPESFVTSSLISSTLTVDDERSTPLLIEPLLESGIDKSLFIETNLDRYHHINNDKPLVNLPVSPREDEVLVDIISTSPVTFDIDKTRGKPTVLWGQCRVNGLYIEQALFDTGSDCNIVEVSFINLLNKRYKRNIRVYDYPRKRGTQGIGGIMSAIGYCDLTISPGNNRGLVSRLFRFTVVEHAPVPFILGIPIISGFNMDIKLSSNTIEYYDYVKGIPTKLITPLKVCTESFTTRFDGHSPYIRVMISRPTTLEVGPKGSSGTHHAVTCTLSRVPTYRHEDYFIHTTPLLHGADIAGSSCIYTDKQLFASDYDGFTGDGFPTIATVLREHSKLAL